MRANADAACATTQAAGGLISAALLATPGASAFYKGGLTVRPPLLPPGLDSSGRTPSRSRSRSCSR